DAGKSSIFDALDIFFNEPKGKPDKGDKNVNSNSNEISITCIFDNLPKELVIDATYPTTLKDEYMLNSEEHFEIKKVFRIGDKITKKFYAIAEHPTKENYNDILSLSNRDLKTRARDINIDLTDVNQSINTQLRRAIWESEDDLEINRSEIDLASITAKAIWEKIRPCLPVYALFKSDRPSTDQDAEAQDPMKSAIKEAIAKKEMVLSEITQQVKNEVQEIANKTVDKIQEMNPELASQLNPIVTNKKWDSLFSVSLTSDDDIPINKRGSGTRRLILLNFFRAKAEQTSKDKNTGVIYAVEEPETSQHPNNQKMLIDAFEDLVESGDCQVLLTTHTPV
ncbi:MAG: ATP-binding protein, partial [Candidatus Heimdallarchaeota archaeon]|nr:ATP-binding protein [Candidatus Heimdallarchaeota archaeon]